MKRSFQHQGGVFDVAVLGIGPDGHIAHCFPHSSGFQKNHSLVRLLAHGNVLRCASTHYLYASGAVLTRKNSGSIKDKSRRKKCYLNGLLAPFISRRIPGKICIGASNSFVFFEGNRGKHFSHMCRISLVISKRSWVECGIIGSAVQSLILHPQTKKKDTIFQIKPGTQLGKKLRIGFPITHSLLSCLTCYGILNIPITLRITLKKWGDFSPLFPKNML